MPDIKKIKANLHEIIFGTSTPAGRYFDLGLLVLILISIITVMLESVPSFRAAYGNWFIIIEWIITILFTLEYLTRIWIVERTWQYVFSFYGIIDLLSILPTFLGLFWAGGNKGLIALRGLRLLRIFKILHLPKYLDESKTIMLALKNSRQKISVFLMTVIAIVIVVATLMYSIEGPENGFTSIPESLYWSVVTITTVGYGDIAPQTALGKMIASILMLVGYAIIAVPTGIVTVSIQEARKKTKKTKQCPACHYITEEMEAAYCSRCGTKLK